MAGEVRTGSIAFDADNAYGLRASGGQRLGGGFALVHRGGPSGEFAPFALKAHYAAWHGAEGLFVINSQSRRRAAAHRAATAQCAPEVVAWPPETRARADAPLGELVGTTAADLEPSRSPIWGLPENGRSEGWVVNSGRSPSRAARADGARARSRRVRVARARTRCARAEGARKATRVRHA